MLIAHKPIGILGGTFDPIHYGHLAIAKFLLQHCPLSEIQFIPCLSPPHRQAPEAGAEHRLQMVRLAIKDHEGWVANDIDYKRPAPSYMIDTLSLLKKQYSQTPLCLILGMDAFGLFNHWRQWQEILSLAHLIVVNRPGFNLTAEDWSQELLSHSQVQSCHELSQHGSGKIFIQTMPPSFISATEIRHQIPSSQAEQLPPAVLNYIKQHHLYRA